MTIWTFWEPHEQIPYCWQLCIETWKKFIPNAEIILLDFNNIHKYIDIKSIEPYVRHFLIMYQTDFYRTMLLEKYGGIWLDIDTIILSNKANVYFTADDYVSFFGDTNSKICYTGFIKTNKNSNCMKAWTNHNVDSVNDLIRRTREQFPIYAKRAPWYFFSNGFIDEYIKNNPNEIKILDRAEVTPEIEIVNDWNIDKPRQAYIDYYFLQSRHISDVNADMVLLHNSWTPEVFRNFGKEEIARCKFTMANLLMETLDIKRNLNAPQIVLKI